MIIRKAVRTDVPGVIELLKEFSKESLNEYGVSVIPEHINGVVDRYIDTAFVVEKEGSVVGILVIVLHQMPINGETIAEELVWYVKKEARMYGVKLLRYVEKWCVEQGVKKLIMIHMANSKAKKLAEFYIRCGYEPLEFHYLKQLGGN